MALPRKGAFSKTDLRSAIDRLKDAVQGKNLTALAETLGVNPNLLYAWRKEGEKEIMVSPTAEDAIKLGRLEKKLGLSKDDNAVAVCQRWLKLSGRQVSEGQVCQIIDDLEAAEQVAVFQNQLLRLHKEGRDLSSFLKTLAVLNGVLTISDLLFLVKSEEELGVEMTSALAKELLSARRKN